MGEIENWKEIPGSNGRYYISDLGRVKNNKGKILSQNRWFEYMEVKLKMDGKYKHYKIHRLVAESFIPNPDNKKQVNHLDGITFHNEVSNLEWCTNEENMKHRRKLWKKRNEIIML